MAADARIYDLIAMAFSGRMRNDKQGRDDGQL
jgi:hypothetical protein